MKKTLLVYIAIITITSIKAQIPTALKEEMKEYGYLFDYLEAPLTPAIVKHIDSIFDSHPDAFIPSAVLINANQILIEDSIFLHRVNNQHIVLDTFHKHHKKDFTYFSYALQKAWLYGLENGKDTAILIYKSLFNDTLNIEDKTFLLNNILISYSNTGDWLNANKTLQKIPINYWEDPRNLITELAETYLYSGDTSKAINVLTKILSSNSISDFERIKAYKIRAEIAFSMGNKTIACFNINFASSLLKNRNLIKKLSRYSTDYKGIKNDLETLKKVLELEQEYCN